MSQAEGSLLRKLEDNMILIVFFVGFLLPLKRNRELKVVVLIFLLFYDIINCELCKTNPAVLPHSSSSPNLHNSRILILL